MRLGGPQRQKSQPELALPCPYRGEAHGGDGQGTEGSAASHGTGTSVTAGTWMEEVCKGENLKAALRRVIQNKGAAGADGMRVEQLTPFLKTHWPRIRAELMEGRYRPSPVRRVEIPKPDGGKRRLGIPTALDRFVQQAILQVMQNRWDRTFSEHSFGFRPGRNAHQAIRQAQRYIEAGYDYVVDIDLEKFFDRVNHDQLMALLARRVDDKRLLKLLRRFLNAGSILADGLVGPPSEEGVPQGGPLSPLLSNLVLDQLDRELERRGHRFVRYADDCNIYVRSLRAGRRVMESLSRYLDRKLHLRVNPDKSGVARPWERTFLGFSFCRDRNRLKCRLAPRTFRRFKSRVRALTRAAKGMDVKQVIRRLAVYLRGWNGYFGVCQTPSTFELLNAWVRRRLRCAIWRQWKHRRRRFAQLRRLGLSLDRTRKTAGSRFGPWRTSQYQGLNSALSNAYFKSLGLPTLVIRESA